jgi:hypothetical protein
MADRYPLPVWQKNGEKVGSLKSAFGNWWDQVEDWIKTPLNQMNAETCSAALLKYHAYQKDVTRFNDEPDELFRKRVKYAEQNAMEAGSKTGFIQIFERLGIGYLEIVEREDAVNWDVVSLRLSDSQVASNTELLSYIVQQYGRTCRRYELTVLTAVEMNVSVVEFGHLSFFDVAKESTGPWGIVATMRNDAVGHSWNLDVATL